MHTSHRRAGRGRRLRWLAASASAAALAAGGLTMAATTQAASATTGTDTALAGSAQDSGPTIPALDWKSCDNGFQCATATVPLDYAHPHDATISLAVVRHLATDPAHRLGTMFFNSGGPAEQNQGFLSSYTQIPAPLRERYDVVSFDPRGFSPSTAISCFTNPADEQKLLAGLPIIPVGAAQVSALVKATATLDAACGANAGPLLDHDTSADNAKDMNLLRQAVGDPVLNYYGQSYGTFLGAVYANLFPAAVGRMVFDGNVDAELMTHDPTNTPYPVRDGEDVSDAQTMQGLLSLCGKASTAACAFSAGSPAATTAKWNTLLARMLKSPVTVGDPKVTWTYNDIITDLPEYQISAWQDDAGLLQQLWVASAHPTAGGAPAPTSGAALDPILASGCSDTADPSDPAAYAAAARAAVTQAGPFAQYGAYLDLACARWPQAAAQDRYTGPWNAPTANTILLVGNTTDPSTPYAGSVALSHELSRARLLTVHGFGHTEFTNPSTCATNAIDAYLTTGALPKPGTVCQQDGTPFPEPAAS